MFAALALSSFLALGACSSSSDDSGPTSPNTLTNGFAWTADGTNYASTTALRSVVSGNMALIGVFSAGNGDSYTININVPAATGTYALGSGATNTFIANYATTVGGTTRSYTASGGAGTGTVTVTEFSTTQIKGTFSFTGAGTGTPATTKVVTNGRFTLPR